ncbi:MAG: efflux RND transporter periplasmic adaptor subunit [Candidatus Paceibacterota bacterium]|jgi:multidrug efflux pump subunit AcrA (membrane-fusion protein)
MLKKLKNFFTKHSNIFYILAGVLIFLAIFGSKIFGGSQTSAEGDTASTTVKILFLSDYRQGGDFVLSSGTIESLEEYDMKSQVNANVNKVYVAIGDSVKAGNLLVTLSNADVAANLAQAKANLQAQQARLDEIKNGTRKESLAVQEAQLAKSKSDLQSLYGSAINVLSDSFAKADDAGRKQTAQLFSNADTDSPKLSFTTSNSQSQIDSEFSRLNVRNTLSKWSSELQTLIDASQTEQIDATLTNGIDYLNTVKNLLANLNKSLDGATALSVATLDGYKTAINGARTSVNSAITSLTAMAQQITAQKLNIDTAQKQYELLLSGAVLEEVKVQEAIVAQASASVDSASAQLQKTIFRSPIDGEISSVSVNAGDLVTAGVPVVSIVNPNGKKITAYVSGEDASRINEGAEVLISGKPTGIVSRISPSIDQKTKKVELTIILPLTENNSLVSGQYVDISISAVPQNGNAENSYFVPIQAVKVADTGSSVFVVDESDNSVKEVSITTGNVSGELVEIKGNLLPTQKIASPSYGLKDGEKINSN